MIDDGWLVMDDWWWVMDDGWVLKIMRIFREFRKYRFWDFYITCSRVETLHPCSVSHNSLFELCFVKFFSKCVKVKVIFLNYKMLNDKYPCYISPSIKTTFYTATYFYGKHSYKFLCGGGMAPSKLTKFNLKLTNTSIYSNLQVLIIFET